MPQISEHPEPSAHGVGIGFRLPMPHWFVDSNEITVKIIINISPDQVNALKKVGTETSTQFPTSSMPPIWYALLSTSREGFRTIFSFFSHHILYGTWGQPQTMAPAIRVLLEYCVWQGCPALSPSYQPWMYQSNRGGEKPNIRYKYQDMEI